jgi:cell wall-associated NlpC family hydrolase
LSKQDLIETTKNQGRKSRKKIGLMSGAAAALVIPGLLGAFALPAQADTVPAATSSTSTSETATTVAAVTTTPAPKPVVKKVVKKKKKLTRLQKAVALAKHYQGVRYRFGGASPAGFDCSGLTKYVYGRLGVKLPHSARAQLHVGHRVSRHAAKPGDLIIFHGGTHVGIYLSAHRMIDAPRPGRRVGIHSIYSNSYSLVQV